MAVEKSVYKICPRGHKYKHSSDCPVCPICWPNYYKEHGNRDFDSLAAPAQRALHNAKIKTVKDLAKWTEEELLELHGMGPSSIPKLKKILKDKNLELKKD